MSVTILLGLQWGDEGKGKMVDILAATHSHVVRSHGGANAGHTLVISNQEYKFHLVPSGIVYPHTHCYLSAGVVLDPEVFLEELAMLNRLGICYKDRLWISLRAHVLFPYHKLIDQALEQGRGRDLIGTTGKGIGPCYTDRVTRVGITVADLMDESVLDKKLKQRYATLDPQVQSRCPLEALLQQASMWRAQLASQVVDVERLVYEAEQRGESILIEGAHGTMLDVCYGTYPFVTSSSCIASGVLAGCGLGPMSVKRVCGVVKAYTTRVGSGPMPTELSQEEQKLFMSHDRAREIGTTTGRLRRMGWLDVPLLRRSIQLSGVSDFVMTKLDILDDLETIKVCTHYQYRGEKIELFPFEMSHFDELKPCYITFKGWKSSTKQLRSFEQLPHEAQLYLTQVSALLNKPLRAVFVGPDREQTISCS